MSHPETAWIAAFVEGNSVVLSWIRVGKLGLFKVLYASSNAWWTRPSSKSRQRTWKALKRFIDLVERAVQIG
jgi:hypothetical protein